MKTLKEELISFEKLRDLTTILSSQGPCATLYMPLGPHNHPQWKNTVGSLENRADQFGLAGQELLKSLSNWDDINPEPEPAVKSIAVFKSADLFRVALLDIDVTPLAVMGPHFYIRPLLPQLVRDQSFYVLALSQKNTRLLHCTSHTSEEVPLSLETKSDFDVWMNQVKPDHNAVNNAMTSGGAGSTGPHGLAPKGSDGDSKEQYLAHYFKQINHGVTEVLRGKTDPLVLCGVEYEIPIYRGLNTYSNLASEEVRGAANSLKSGEMHARAIEALERSYLTKVDNVLGDWNHRVGSGASNRLKDVVTAAHDGRILTLIISDSQEQTGSFDEATNSVKGRPTGTAEDEDLVNDAAVQTILHAGDVLVAPHHKMPNGNPLAAIFRY